MKQNKTFNSTRELLRMPFHRQVASCRAPASLQLLSLSTDDGHMDTLRRDEQARCRRQDSGTKRAGTEWSVCG